METTRGKRITNIAEILGPKDSRYCSNGFRNVQFDLTDIERFDRELRGRVRITFRDAWSSKEGARQEPHLGTAEYVAIAFLTLETYLRDVSGFAPEDIARSWVKRVKLTTLPELERSDVQPVCLRDRSSGAEADREGSLEVTIGHMRIELTVLYPAEARRRGSVGASVCDPENSFYKNGYKTVDHDILNVENDFAAMRSSGEIVLRHSGRRYEGVGCHYFPTMDAATFILISGQLMQVLVYGLDDLPREKTNNLWLRGLEIDYPAPLPASAGREEVECTSFRKVRLKGNTWRVADVRFSLGNIEAVFNVAHQITEEHEETNSGIRDAEIEQDADSQCAVHAHRPAVHPGSNDLRMV